MEMNRRITTFYKIVHCVLAIDFDINIDHMLD